MDSNQFSSTINSDFSASFWLQEAIQAASSRDVLDALIDAEALLEFCRVRAREAGLNV